MAVRLLPRVIKNNACRKIGRYRGKRGYSSTSVDASGADLDISSISLSQSVPWVPAPKYTDVGHFQHDTSVTVLDNGLRIASENKFGQFCTVGVLIDSGSRYEVAHISGITHFLEKLAFGRTDMFKNKDDILQHLEKLGGICDCQGSRDTLIYAASAETNGLASVVDMLSDVALRPLVSDDEVRLQPFLLCDEEGGSAEPLRRIRRDCIDVLTCHLRRLIFRCIHACPTCVYGAVVDIIREPVMIHRRQLQDARAAISFELESLHRRPDPEPLLMEMIHTAAFKDNTFGLPKICPEENIPVIDSSTLYGYLQSVHIPQRMVVAGVGMEHAHLVDVCRRFFLAEKKAIWDDRPELAGGATVKPVDRSLSQYTGGIVTVEKDLSDVSLGPTPMPELAHLVVGLESCSHADPDFIAFCVLNMLMGGGGSFSAGGPGKGMYTRLYLNVLNRFHWMYNATAYNHAYQDSGLFCVHASAHPSKLRELVEVVLRELASTAGEILSDELARAKRQLQSMLLMNLEARPVVFEDIGRQVLASGVRRQPSYYFDEIGKITAGDINRVANRMLRAKPAVAAYGTLGQLPKYSDIETALLNKDGRMPRRFQLFR